MEKEKTTKYILVVIAGLSMVVDNTLLTAILPILPEYFYKEEANHVDIGIPFSRNLHDINSTNNTIGTSNCTPDSFLLSENIYFGLLVAAKPFVQFIVAALIGPFVDKCGYDVPMFLGFGIIIASSLVFGYGITYVVLFMARSFQGIGSACIDVASFAMVADMFDDPDQRSKMLGFVLSGYGFGILIGPPFGSFTYITAGKAAPFIIIACFTAVLAIAYLFSHKLSIKSFSKNKDGTHIKMLLMDPYVMMCALAVCISTLAVGVLETGQPLWMMKTMCPKKWMLGVGYLPESISYVAALLIYPFIIPNSIRWVTLTIGIVVMAISTILLPFAQNVWMLFGPGIFFGLAFAAIDYSIFPMLSEVVDKRHLPGMYGRAFAILEFSFCFAYAVGPLLSAALVAVIGYRALMISVGIASFICFPIGIYLRDIPPRDQSTETVKLLEDEP